MADQDELQARTQGIVPTQPVAFFYFNGFEINATLSDFGMMLLFDGHPISKLAMSFTTAKTLVKQLGTAIEVFEEHTSQELLTMDDVAKAYEKARNGSE